jgi:hypothetical protein|tara:strand:+ start:7676 stop:7978 length:303 start_codon:yes stop_codon:yes gene_type:complete
MPTYCFRDETGDEWEEFMSIANMEEYLRTYDNIKILLQPTAIVAGVSVKDKSDGGWKDTLSRVAEANPHSALAKQHGAKDKKSVANRNFADKHFHGGTGK